ncbi:MAG TPA: hypothetical protein VGU45_01165 [Microvirga sp.]|nr:hypothetical protein [Microvirga sp.]
MSGVRTSIYWMRTADTGPEWVGVENDFVAYDGETQIGRVHNHAAGADAGLWLWSMTLVLPGPPFVYRSGREEKRGDAARRVVEAYERMMARQP